MVSRFIFGAVVESPLRLTCIVFHHFRLYGCGETPVNPSNCFACCLPSLAAGAGVVARMLPSLVD